MDNALDSLKGDFTLEIWTTENERAFGAQVFYMRPADQRGINFAWATGAKGEGFFHAVDYSVCPKVQHDLRGFELGNETYIAFSCKVDGGGYKMDAYKYSREGLSVFSATVRKPLKETKHFALGARLWEGSKFSDAISSFNECRVWKRCLTKSEIERSAKAGPDKLVL